MKIDLGEIDRMIADWRKRDKGRGAKFLFHDLRQYFIAKDCEILDWYVPITDDFYRVVEQYVERIWEGDGWKLIRVNWGNKPLIAWEKKRSRFITYTKRIAGYLIVGLEGKEYKCYFAPRDGDFEVEIKDDTDKVLLEVL